MMKYTFKADKNYSKLRYYLQSIGLSTNTIKQLSKYEGQIRQNNKPIIMNQRVCKNSIIEINIEETEISEIVLTKGNLNIYYEDKYLLVVYKETGTATIPSYCNNENSLANYVCYYMSKTQPDFIYRAINRLDKDTSGFIIICKDIIIYNLMSKYKIIKKYEVVTIGKLKKQTITYKIISTKNECERNNILREIDNEKGKDSITKILYAKYYKKYNLSYGQIRIFTGRTHQIRLHLSTIKCPILGDRLYGNKKADRMFLNCYYISFYHPILKKRIKLKNVIFKNKIKELNQAYLEDYQNEEM